MEDIQAATDTLAAATSHPVTVQLITQGTGIWGNVATGLITGLLTGGITLTGIWLTHLLTKRREQLKSEDKLIKERVFIATELVFILEKFAETCTTIATHGAYENRYSLSGEEVELPEIDFSDVKGDWSVLPARLMYRIRELPVIKQSSERTITTGYRAPPYFEDATITRRYEYTRLGIRALVLARSLRKLAGFIQTRSDDTIWPAKRALIKVWTLEKRRRRNMEMLYEQDLLRADLKRSASKTTDKNHNSGVSF
ncbi:TPA: hypothetical protein ACHTOV_004330 [Enterobacter cancerogenus]|jgi:hypothetical protein